MMTPGVDLYGENMTSVHSIKYTNLTSYFYLFAVKNGETWLGWDEVVEIAESLQIPTVPVKYRGKVESLEQLERMISGWASEPSAVSSSSSSSSGVDASAANAADAAGAAGAAGAASASASCLPAEGFVCRNAAPFIHAQFDRSLAKYVRADHNQLEQDGKHNWTKATLNR